MIVIGIDPGVTGAIAMVDRTGFRTVHDLPVAVRSQGKARVHNQVDPWALTRLLREVLQGHDKNEIVVVLELVNGRPAQDVSTVFSLAHSAGIIEGVIAALGLRLFMEPPHQWKKAVGLGRPAGAPKLDAAQKKEAARQRAIMFYPTAPLSRKKDHNRAEAILIARHGYQQHA